MGQRSFLYLQNTNRQAFLFEANNSLPFFWLLLTSPESIERWIRDWQVFTQFRESHSEEETDAHLEQHTYNITVSQDTFKQQAAQNKVFLQKHFPDAVPLFNDFTNTIASKFETNDHIEIDIAQFSDFFDTPEKLYNALRNEVEAIASNKPDGVRFIMTYDLIAGGSGFESIDNKGFSALPSYRKAEKQRTAPSPEEYKPSKSTRRLSLIILILCPFFSFLAYRGYRDQGLSFTVILMAVVNLGFYVFSIWSLVADIKASAK